MKNHNRKTSPLINIKLFNESGETVANIKSRKKMRVISFLQGKKFSKAVLRVAYNDKHDNSGCYHNKEHLKKALRDFTEIELIRYLED